MEWVETTARTVEEAKERALDQLGVVADEAEFDVLEEPRPGLFGRLRGEARVRARVRPAQVRPKQERRRGRRDGAGDGAPGAPESGTPEAVSGDDQRPRSDGGRRSDSSRRGDGRARSERGESAAATPTAGSPPTDSTRGAFVTDGPIDAPSDQPGGGARIIGADDDVAEVAVADVQAAAETFMSGLADAFGLESSVSSSVDGNEIEVRVEGASLGLLVGPGGRTLLSIQDLARVAAQRKLGDHDTRLRVDVAGYRQKRRAALERFANQVAEQVRESGVARSLDPMPSADRKVLHDALAAIDGVSSRSEGEDPNRRIVVVPA